MRRVRPRRERTSLTDNKPSAAQNHAGEIIQGDVGECVRVVETDTGIPLKQEFRTIVGHTLYYAPNPLKPRPPGQGLPYSNCPRPALAPHFASLDSGYG